MTRTSKNWITRPGGWDETHCYRRRFSGCGRFGFPEIEPVTISIERQRRLLSYCHRDDSGFDQAESLCHFFLDDYRFESVWRYPDRAMNRVRRFWATLTPDFSLYTDWPVAAQIWNTYRSRWTGRYWQEHGITVIPSVNWSDRQSWDWCFNGLPQDSIVAISVPNLKTGGVERRFRQGFKAMSERLKPRQIIVYGKLPFTDPRCLEFKPDWLRLRQIKES